MSLRLTKSVLLSRFDLVDHVSEQILGKSCTNGENIPVNLMYVL